MNGHKIVNQNSLHFLTITVVGWIDVFTRQKYRDVIIQSLRYCKQHKGLVINAYVIMSNHIHIIAYAQEGYNLSHIIRDFKRFTARAIIQDIIQSPEEGRSEWMLRLFKYHGKYNGKNDKFQFWIQDNHPIELVSPSWIKQKLDYIHLNPVRSGLVDNGEKYLYSSARQYGGKKGILGVEIIDLGMWGHGTLLN